MRTLADFEYEDSSDPYSHYTNNGETFLDAESLLATGFCGFCGCGNGSAALEHVLGGLEIIAEKAPPDRKDFDKWWKKHQADEQAHFGNSGAAYFFYYWAAKQDLTEHGGSVPGWLTDKGKELLGLLREWAALPEEQ